jgi:hypothetical protein
MGYLISKRILAAILFVGFLAAFVLHHSGVWEVPLFRITLAEVKDSINKSPSPITDAEIERSGYQSFTSKSGTDVVVVNVHPRTKADSLRP